MSNESLVFQAGGVIFALASLYFLFSGSRRPNLSTEFFISFITTTSYALMSLGVATTVSKGGHTVYWSRWLFYMVACSLLMYDTAKVLSIPDGEYPKMAILTWLTMFNGFLASYIVTASRYVFFMLSSAAAKPSRNPFGTGFASARSVGRCMSSASGRSSPNS